MTPWRPLVAAVVVAAPLAACAAPSPGSAAVAPMPGAAPGRAPAPTGASPDASAARGGQVAPAEPDPAASRRDDETDHAKGATPQQGRLAVPGFAPAFVSFPERPRPTEPLLVAVHGAGDGPRWQCSLWREILGERGVVLCPAGRPLGRSDDDGFYHPDHHALGDLLVASLEALARTFGDRVDARRAVYAAYSQGATMGAHVVVERASSFPRLVLVEGGFAEWNVPIGNSYREAGGERVLFACGTRGCERAARRSAGWLERAGLATRLESAPGAGHTYGGAVARRVREALPWLLEGDDRW